LDFFFSKKKSFNASVMTSRNGGYGSISFSSGSTSTGFVGNTTVNKPRAQSQRKNDLAASFTAGDMDIAAILAATSITSITGQPSKALQQYQGTTNNHRHHHTRDSPKDKGKEKNVSSPPARRRNQAAGRGYEEPIFHTVTRTDTLEGIALKYDVQVADLKRVNRLFSNQDLFARKEVVIPVLEEEQELDRPRRSYEKGIKPSSGRRSFESGPKFFYPATPEEEVVEQRKSLLGVGYNLSSHGENIFGDTNEPRMRQMGESVRRRLEEEEEKLYGL